MSPALVIEYILAIKHGSPQRCVEIVDICDAHEDKGLIYGCKRCDFAQVCNYQNYTHVSHQSVMKVVACGSSRIFYSRVSNILVPRL